jgi:hypothetical protein
LRYIAKYEETEEYIVNRDLQSTRRRRLGQRVPPRSSPSSTMGRSAKVHKRVVCTAYCPSPDLPDTRPFVPAEKDDVLVQVLICTCLELDGSPCSGSQEAGGEDTEARLRGPCAGRSRLPDDRDGRAEAGKRGGEEAACRRVNTSWVPFVQGDASFWAVSMHRTCVYPGQNVDEGEGDGVAASTRTAPWTMRSFVDPHVLASAPPRRATRWAALVSC